MRYSASGSELNIYYSQTSIKNLKNVNDLLKEVREMHLNFDSNRETHPANIPSFSDEDGSEINYITNNKKDFLLPNKDDLIFGHYFIYSDAGYNFESKKKIKEFYVNVYDFIGEKIYEDLTFDKKKKETIDLEIDGTGESAVEQTFFIWLGKNKKLISKAYDFSIIGFEDSGKYDSNQKKNINSYTSEVFKLIK